MDFSLPYWIIIYFRIIGLSSIILNSATIYLILFKSEKIDNFRYFLLSFQILCTHTDLHLTFLIQPMPMSPLVAGYCNGILAKDFGIWSHYLISFVIIFLIAQMECLVYCFVKKHQTIAKLTHRHILHDGCYTFGNVLWVCSPIFIGFMFSQAAMDRGEQLEFVKKNHPSYYQDVLKVPNFAIYTINNYLIFVILSSFFGGVFCAMIFILFTADMLLMLRDIQQKVSVSSFNRYKIAVKSLLAQFATSSLLLAPLFFFVIVTASQLENTYEIAELLVAIMPLHSSVNAIVLVATTPPFKNFVLRKNRKRRLSVSMYASQSSLNRLKSFFSFL